MKKSVKIVLLFAVMALITVSCSKEILGRKGERIHFSAGSASDGTKTSYGNVDESARTQAINWVQGDLIKIAGKNCPVDAKEGTTDIADYKVVEVNPDSRGENYGKIDVNGSGLGLVWGEPGTTHNFYAVYPNSGTVTTEGIITGSIDKVQEHFAPSYDEASKTHIVKPDMTNLFMVAKTLNVESGSKIKIGEEEIFLDFKPLSTALEFTIENGFDSKELMKVKKVALQTANTTGSQTNILNGGFVVTMNADGKNNRPKTEATGTGDATRRSVEIDFGSTPVEVAYGDKMNFIFFLNPGNTKDIDDLYFIISFVDNRDATKTVTRKALMRKENGDHIAFPTHKKTRISGLIVPEAIKFDIEGDLVVSPWKDNEEGSPEFSKE